MAADSEPNTISRADLDECRRRLALGSKSFALASRLLPGPVADAAVALYAFCRLADDTVDAEDGDLAALDRLGERLELAYAGDPTASPVDRAFAATVALHDIPRALPEALLEGMAWDLAGQSYETLDELLDYAARVAAAVGAMMAVVMGVRDPGRLARACDLGSAMQLTNIARDVGEDALMGRLYLPRAWLREAGLDPDGWLAEPQDCPEIRACTARLIEEAQQLYVQARPGIAALPLRCRPAIYAARNVYREIGREVARMDYGSLHCRAVVSTPRKLLLLGGALLRTPLPAGAVGGPAHPANQYLVDAASAGEAAVRGRMTTDEQWAWLVDLMVKLEAHDRSGGRPVRSRGRQLRTGRRAVRSGG